MKNYSLPLLLAVLFGCTAPSTSDQINQPIRASKPPLPRTYWPLDHTAQRSQTTLPGKPGYRITVVTASLNDSAVVNPVTTDAGPELDISHNYESLLTVTQGKHLLTQARLSKALFRHERVAQTLGPLTTLALSRTTFVNYRAPEFYFTTRLGVPDSDMFAEAKVALAPNQQLRVVSLKMPKESE